MLAYYPPEWESLQSRVVGRWCPSFSGNTGLQLPDTMGRNHGTLTNFANNGNDAYVSSGGNTSLLFRNQRNVQYNRVDINTVSLSAQTRFSVSAWANLSSLVPNFGAGVFCWGNLAQFNSDVFLFVGSNGIINIQINNGADGSATASSFPVGSWVHIALVFNGSGTTNAQRMQLHINGIEQTLSFAGYTVPSSTSTLSNTTVFRLGAYLEINDASAYQWNGFLDDFILFDRNTTLTANEVRFIYEQGRGGGLLMQPPRRRSVAAVIAALVLTCETGNYSLTGQAAGLFASRLLAADQAQYLLSGNAANITASRLLSVDPASYTATGNDAATICARLLDGGAAAYALTGTDAGLIANRKLTADQAVCFLAGNNSELLRSLKLNAGSMSLQLDNVAASLLANRKISADGAQYILVVSDANLGDSASGVAPYYYLFMLRGPQ
jgi:hypothetical protein